MASGAADASFVADMLALKSDAAAHGRHESQQAIRLLARAVAACPARLDLRMRMSRAVLVASPTAEPIAAAICAATLPPNANLEGSTGIGATLPLPAKVFGSYCHPNHRVLDCQSLLLLFCSSAGAMRQDTGVAIVPAP